MIIVKSIGFGLLSIIAGNLIGLILSIIFGFAVERIAVKFLSEPAQKKYRHLWMNAWVGFVVGMINATLVYFYKMNGWVLLIIFLVYLVFFMGKSNFNFVFYEICAGDEKQFYKLSRTSEIITFISHIIGLYGLYNIFFIK